MLYVCISLFPMSMSTVYVCIQVQYLQDFAERLELNIWYNTEIKEVTRPPPSEEYEESVPFHLEDQNQILHLCDVLIVRYGNYPHVHIPVTQFTSYHNLLPHYKWVTFLQHDVIKEVP